MTIQLRICVLAVAVLARGLLADEETEVEAAPADGGTNEVGKAEMADDPKFERYKTILDRMPFGPEPENFDPDDPSGDGGSADPGSPEAAAAAAEAAAQEEAQKIIAAVRVSALNVTPSGSVAVGFSDNSKQPAATYYMKVGETRDGWTVKDADAREMTVTLEKDGVDATLKLGEGSDPKEAKKGGGKQGPQRKGSMGRRLGGLGPRPQLATDAEEPAAPTGGSPLANLRARQARAAAARREEQRREEEAAAQAKAERERAAEEREQAKAEREQQQQTLQQIREELQRQREARAQQEQQERPQQDEVGEGGGEAEP